MFFAQSDYVDCSHGEPVTGLSARMAAQFVTDALVISIWQRDKPDALCIILTAAATTAVNSSADSRQWRRLLDQPLGPRLGQCDGIEDVKGLVVP